MIVLAVTIRCKKEKISEAKRFFSAFVERARSEPGCVHYDLFQGRDDAQIFYFFEKWADAESFEIHSRQPYLGEFHDRFGELLEEPNKLLYLSPIVFDADRDNPQ